MLHRLTRSTWPFWLFGSFVERLPPRTGYGAPIPGQGEAATPALLGSAQDKALLDFIQSYGKAHVLVKRQQQRVVARFLMELN